MLSRFFKRRGAGAGSPDAPKVARRAQILALRIVHASAWPPPTELPGILDAWTAQERESLHRQFKDRSQKIQAYLKSTSLSAELTAEERKFFKAQLLERTMQQFIDSLWLMESLACCLWALELLPELPAYDTQSSDLLDYANKIAGQTAFRLRSVADIERARSVAELWHWRSRTRQLMEETQPLPPLPEGLTLEKIIQMASAKAAKEGIIPSPIGDDFPAFGKAYRDLSQEEYSTATSIASERHRALNWICGRAPKNQWDKTPTDT